jgi:hypothetical protein
MEMAMDGSLAKPHIHKSSHVLLLLDQLSKKEQMRERIGRRYKLESPLYGGILAGIEMGRESAAAAAGFLLNK